MGHGDQAIENIVCFCQGVVLRYPFVDILEVTFCGRSDTDWMFHFVSA